MRKLYTALALLSAAAAQAQSFTTSSARQDQLLHQLLSQSQTGTAQKPTTLSQRLIARLNIRYSLLSPGGYDSTRYYYNNNDRGSFFDYNYMSYSNTNGYFADAPALVQADSSTYRAGDSSNMAQILFGGNRMLYTGFNTLADYKGYDYSVSSGIKAYHTGYTYDAQNRLATLLYQRDSALPPVWKNTYRHFYTYNPQGRVLLDSVERYDNATAGWQPESRYLYTYDASGIDPLTATYQEMQVGTFHTLTVTSNSFYPGHLLKTSLVTADASGTGLAPVSLDSFGYAGSNSFYTYWLRGYYSNGSFTPSSLLTRHVSATGRPDTLYTHTWNGTQLSLSQKAVCTYTVYNNPAVIETFLYSAGSFIPFALTRYHYEEYTPTGIDQAAATMQDVQLFPNPAAHTLGIRWGNVTAGTPVTICITGMNGQTVYSRQLRWTQPTQQLPVDHLQAGLYSVSIAGQDGRTLYTGRFVKQ